MNPGPDDKNDEKLMTLDMTLEKKEKKKEQKKKNKDLTLDSPKPQTFPKGAGMSDLKVCFSI